MDFSEDGQFCKFLITNMTDSSITVNRKTELTTSFFMTPTCPATSWEIHKFSALDKPILTPLLEQKPELLIIGTGNTYCLPNQAQLALPAQIGIACEFMTNNAACRSFNLLANDGRNICLGVIF